MVSSLQDPITRARCSLEGLSVGDAFGETFFVDPDFVEGLIAERALAARTWTYTDDTLMAMSIFYVLRQHGHIHQAALAQSFAERYDRTRGYGPAMHRLLWEIKCGEDWSERASSLCGPGLIRQRRCDACCSAGEWLKTRERLPAWPFEESI